MSAVPKARPWSFPKPTLTTANLGLEAMRLDGTPAEIGTWLGKVDKALQYVHTERAKLGARMNRLGNTVGILANSFEATSASRSRIADTDISVEASRLVRTQILNQAAMAMAAQANASATQAMALLGARGP
jgi:flagellin